MNALAVATSELARPSGEFSSGTHALRIFDRVPSGHDVVPLCGMVAVSHPHWLDIVEGGFYVVETQHPPGGMVWQTYDEHVRRYDMDGGPRTLLKTSRRVIRAVRREATGDAWWFIDESGFADGPIKAWAAGHNVVGEIVGIYQSGNP